MSQVTNYKGIGKLYFNRILLEIIKIGKLQNTKKKILDYGCGRKQLANLLNRKIYNYDKNKKYNEIEKLQFQKYDIIVLNHVLMYLNANEIKILFDIIYKKNKNCFFIIGIGKQNLISKIAKLITLNLDAHKNTVLNYKDQLQLLKKRLKILKIKKNIYFMTDIFYLKFKKNQ